jgi:ubiquinone/menaquinone biosynthesis C-methylase UbiE
MLSIGHRTRIFDVMAQLPPSTVQEIASESNLNERYVKEWLGAMVTGRIIDYDSAANKFSLPKEKAQYLTREKSVYNFAASMQWIPVLSQVEDEIVNCFRKGGGVPYSSYERFHEVMAEESYQTVVVALTDHIFPLVPNLVDKLKNGIKVLDIGCGKGRAINVMANHFKNSKFYGYDLSQEAIDGAKREAQRMGNSNTSFKVQDILGMDFDEKYDLITAFDAIHDQPDPYSVLGSIYNSLDDKGIFLMQDILASTPLNDNIGHPLGTFSLYYIVSSLCKCIIISKWRRSWSNVGKGEGNRDVKRCWIY